MADLQARTGIEFEFQSVKVLFAKADGTPFPSTTQFPIGDAPLCYPVRYTDYNFLNPTGSTKWDGQWGFRVVYDSPAPGVLNKKDTRTAILELNTSAQLISDYEFWAAARLAAQAFDETATSLETFNERSALVDATGGKWITLEEFLKRYNSRVDKLSLDPALRDRFKLEISPTAYAKAYKVAEADRWTPYVTYSGKSFRDVQLSYEVDLKFLDRSFNPWVNMWSTIWWRYFPASSKVPSMMDTDIGVDEPCTEEQVFRNQILAALWRQAYAQARQIVPDALIADLDQRSLVRGLVMYLLVGGAVRLPKDELLLKKSFTQLPKTSPASIGRLLKQLYPGLAPVLAGLGNQATATNAHNFIVNTMRNLPQLVANGMLPSCGPYPVLPNGAPPDILYQTPSPQENIVAPPTDPNVAATERANFIELWKLSLNYDAAIPGAALTDTNTMGYTTAAPFYCTWAGNPGDVKSSFPAKSLGPGSIRVLFESRIHFNIINIGFSPRAMPCMARRSYFRLHNTFIGGAHPAGMTQLFDRLFPESPLVVQNIQLGPGPNGAARRQFTH